MRLETPVIYFYPPEGSTEPISVDVDVKFRRGWVTEYFPKAKVDAPGLHTGDFQFGEIEQSTVGRVTWNNVQVGAEGNLPKTDEHVWLAPRNTQAANLVVGNEAEKYLFYRGVGDLPAPIRVTTDRKSNELKLFQNITKHVDLPSDAVEVPMWLVHVREDGTGAYRTLPKAALGKGDEEIGTTSSEFSEADYSPDGIEQLKKKMHDALVEDGLFADEATAMLDTWQRAYFVSGGLRVFYLVPRFWTDHYLPLTLSKPAKIERVMIGRIELITDQQRDLLTKMASMKIGDGKWVRQIKKTEQSDKFFAGRMDFGDLGVDIPEAYQAYLALGRFRNALIIDQHRQTRSANLKRFIDVYRLKPFQVAERKESETVARAERRPKSE